MRLPFVFSLVLAACTAFGQADKTVEDLLTKMRTSYKNTKSAKMTTKTHGLRAGAKQNLTVEISYANPMKIHALVKGLESMEGKALTVVCDGKNIKTVGNQNMKFEMPYSNDVLASLLLGNLEMLCFWDYQKQLSTSANMKGSKLTVKPNQKWNGKTWTVLEEVSPRIQQRYAYYVDPKTYLIWRTEVRDMSGKKVLSNYEITSLKTGVALDSKLFQMG